MDNSGDTLTIQIDATEDGARLDKVLVARVVGLGRAGARKLFAAGQVQQQVGDHWRVADKGARAQLGERFKVAVGGIDRSALPDPNITITVVKESADWVVLDKAAGMPSAPLLPGERGTAANGLVARYPEMAEFGYSPREPGLCHRLDNGTSGLLLAARNRRAFDCLTGAIRASKLEKRYLLLCQVDALKTHASSKGRGRIDFPLLPHPRDNRRVQAFNAATTQVPSGARPSLTEYRVLRSKAGVALVEARASRAYRHQLRVHFAAIGAPLLGDVLYGGVAHDLLQHHALHASRIRWRGNVRVDAFDVKSPMPPHLATVLG